jgi:SPP1 gp7 family putative phage head morphogenesis protein
MTGKNYWQDRQEQKYLAGEKKVNDYYTGLKKSFEQAKTEIQSVINDFYWRYAEENGLTFASAQLKLSQAEIGGLRAFINKVNENTGKYNLELNNMSIRARITRYEALEKQIDAQLQQLYAIEYQHKGEELLKEVYSDSYYQTWFNIDQYHGFHSEFAQISAQAVNELITYPFNGADFSTRLWKQKDYLMQQLGESITTMLVQGRNPQTLTSDFSKKFGTREYEAYRLLHTEGSFIMEQASQSAYAEDGVEKYQWLATLDAKTCEDCQAMDGMTFDVGKGVVGITMPPLHSFDRCTTVPYYDDQDLSAETRVARDYESGASQKVPANMKYPEWKDKYITKETEKEYSDLIGLSTSNGLKVTGISDHLVSRAIERKVSAENAKDALLNPLKVGKIKKGEDGNSQEYTGEYARVIINPDTGNIITIWKTKSKLRNKLKGAK